MRKRHVREVLSRHDFIIGMHSYALMSDHAPARHMNASDDTGVSGTLTVCGGDFGQR